MIKKSKMAAAALAAVFLYACEGEQPPPPAAAPLPAQVCDKAREVLDKLGTTGSFEYSSDGQATMFEAIWLPMPAQQRDGVAQALGFHAACSAKQPLPETSITIKNEGGRVLTQRVVETNVDLSRIFQE